jgi:hypothetical protein
VLHDAAVLQDDHRVGDREGLLLVVRHIDRGDAEFGDDAADLGAHLEPELRVEVRERLVKEEDTRLEDERPGEGDALLLATGEFGRAALAEVAHLDHLKRFADTPPDFVSGPLSDLEAEGDIVGDGHVRPEGVALEDHAGVSLVRGQVADIAVVEQDPARGRLDEARDHAEKRRLAAARGPKQKGQLA